MNTFITKIVSVIGLIAPLLISEVQATEFNQIQIDKSTVSFVFKQMNVPVEGNFKRFKSQISFDPAKPTLAKAEIEIDLSSVDAGSDEANEALPDKLLPCCSGGAPDGCVSPVCRAVAVRR